MNSAITLQKPAKKSKLSFAGLLVILLAVFLGARLVYWHFFLPRQATASDLTIDSILSAVNRERALRNLLSLAPDARLSAAAQSKSSDMQARHYFSHTDPEGNYIWPKIVATGYTPYLQLGENLAIEFYSTESLVNAWMNSPTHRANILNEGFKDQGMGLEFGDAAAGQYHSAITNTFGTLAVKKPASPPPAEVKAENTPPPAKTEKPATPPAPLPPAPLPPKTELPEETGETAKPAKPQEQLAIRGGGEGNYALPQTSPETPSSTASPPPAAEPLELPSRQNKLFEDTSPVAQPKNPLDFTRYLSLIFTALIIFFIVSDIKDAFENKLAGLDKKINNLALLVLALIVIIFLYWL